MSFSFTPAAVSRHPIPNHPTAGDALNEKPSLEDLFNYGRIKTSAPLWHKILFMCYLPLGLLVLVVRITLFLMLCVSVLLLPRSLGDPINIPLLRFVCGFVVRNNYKGKPLADGPYVIAANHIADFGMLTPPLPPFLTFPYSLYFPLFILSSSHIIFSDTFALWLVMSKFHTLTAGHLKYVSAPPYCSLSSILSLLLFLLLLLTLYLVKCQKHLSNKYIQGHPCCWISLQKTWCYFCDPHSRYDWCCMREVGGRERGEAVEAEACEKGGV